MSVSVYAKVRDRSSCIWHLTDGLVNSGPGNMLTLSGNAVSTGGKWGGGMLDQADSYDGENVTPWITGNWNNINPLKRDCHLDFWMKPEISSDRGDLCHFKGLGFNIYNSTGTEILRLEQTSGNIRYLNKDGRLSADSICRMPDLAWHHVLIAVFRGYTDNDGTIYSNSIFFWDGVPLAIRSITEAGSLKFGSQIHYSTSSGNEVSWYYKSSNTKISEIHFSAHRPEIQNFYSGFLYSDEEIELFRVTPPTAAYTGNELCRDWFGLAGQKVYDGTSWRTLKSTDKIRLNGEWRPCSTCNHSMVRTSDPAASGGSTWECEECGLQCQHAYDFTGTCPVCGYTK